MSEIDEIVRRSAREGAAWAMLSELLRLLVDEGVLTKSQVIDRVEQVQEQVAAVVQGLAAQELPSIFDDLRKSLGGKASLTKN